MGETDSGKNIATSLSEDIQKKIKDGAAGLDKVSLAATNLLDMVGSMIQPFSKVQSAAIELAKSVGIAGKSIMGMTERMIAQNKALSLSMNYNISNEQMFELQGKVLSKIGRNIAIDNVERVYKNDKGEVVDKGFGGSEIENLVAARTVFGDEVVSDIIAGFDKIGKSMNAATKTTGKLFKQASEYGINLTTYAKNFTSNLGMAQRYNFREGVKGLQEMARKATEIRQDMNQISRFAEKVGTVEGAVETASRLQVLGGSFAELANPLAMMNEGLTNMTALQDRFNKMTKNAAYYDASRKEVRMDPLERMKLIRAAEAMGVDANNLLEQAFSQARIGEVKSQMQGYAGFSPEVQKLLPNVATIDSETGLAGATIGGEFKTLAEIAGDKTLQEKLIEETRTESEDIKVIAKSVIGIEAMVSGRKEQIRNEVALNKTKPGVLGGVSSVEAVVDALVNAMDNRFVSAVGKMGFPLNNVENVAVAGLVNSLSELAKPFDSQSLEEFKSMMSDSLGKVFGTEGDFPTFVQSAVNKLSDVAADVVTAINDFTNRTLQIDFLHRTVATGIDMPKKETDINVPSVFQPSQYFYGPAGVGTYTSFRQGGQSSISPTYLNSPYQNKTYIFSANDKTMSSETVSKPAPLETSGTQAYKGNGEYTINLNGTLSMDVNGDNGKIGTIDIVQLMKNNNGLMSEFSKMISDAIEKINKQGASTNSQ